MPAGDVFGLDGFFLNKSNPITVSSVEINQTTSGAGIAITAGTLDTTAGIATLTLSNAAGLSTTPFYTGAKIAVSGVGNGYNGVFVVTGFAGTTTVSYATTGYVGSVSPSVTVTGLSILVTDSAVTNTTWSSAQTHGWFGGASPASLSSVDRIDFSNDSATASVRGPLSLARSSAGAAGNSNYGWFGGGFTPTVVISTVDRIDFSNDSIIANVRGPLSSARQALAATGNSNYGWFGGGAAPGVRSSVDRIDFSNDLATVPIRGPLNLARFYLSATGNSNYGWFGGGQNPALTPSGTNYSTIDRIDFSNDLATASVRGPLSSVRYYLAATSGQARSSSIRLQKAGSYGWLAGGEIFTVPTYTSYSTINRIDFFNDLSTASVRSPISSATKGRAAGFGNNNYGWIVGGASNGSSVSTVDRIDFSNDAVPTSTRSSLSSVISSVAGTGNSNYGWFGGNTSTVGRITFVNDLTTPLTRGSLSQFKSQSAATGNSNYGWWAGGQSPGPPYQGNSNVDRINFSNDSSTASPRGPLSGTRYSFSATGNSNYGWFVAGTINGGSSGTTRVDRIDFSNDLAIASLRNSITTARFSLAATGNSNYGWFGGGATAVSTYITSVERINFSNDLTTTSPRGSLSLARSVMAPSSNTTR